MGIYGHGASHLPEQAADPRALSGPTVVPMPIQLVHPVMPSIKVPLHVWGHLGGIAWDAANVPANFPGARLWALNAAEEGGS